MRSEFNANIGGGTSRELTIAAVQFYDNAARYRCLVTDNSGSEASDIGTLTVKPPMPAISAQPVNALVNLGVTAWFMVEAESLVATTVFWQKNAREASDWSGYEETTVTALSGGGVGNSLHACAQWNADALYHLECIG
jgi:hypothetical protein